MGRRIARAAPLTVTPALALAITLIASVPARAQDGAKDKDLGDKSGYTLFKPTPRAQMREFQTDRPDTTESPFTVDAGHFQIELSLVEFTRDRTAATDVDQVSALPMNLKLGLLNNVDLQLLLSPYVNVREKTAGRNTRTQGFGDATVRLKVNLLGNDGGPIAIGVMPFVTFPTGRGALSDDHVEGGLIVMASAGLPGGFEVGAMVEADVLRDSDNRRYGTSILHTLTVGHDLWGDLRGYVEYVGAAPIDLGETYTASLGTGLTLGLGDDVQLDGGVTLGISDSATDVGVFVGLSFRL